MDSVRENKSYVSYFSATREKSMLKMLHRHRRHRDVAYGGGGAGWKSMKINEKEAWENEERFEGRSMNMERKKSVRG